ncbi:hypothetical protein E4U59_004711 [Claviceps monticola]|nr:hypothetical protein E4U59_004711 [Claviceps monticola]
MPCYPRDDCILDSGCNAHTFNDIKWFTYLKTRVAAKPMMASNGQYFKVAGVGIVRLSIGDDFLELTNTQFAPQAEGNMISPGLLRSGGVIMDGRSDQLVSAGTGLPSASSNSGPKTVILNDEVLIDQPNLQEVKSYLI